MPAKNGQISPVGRRLWCPDHGRYPRRQAVLPKRGTTAKNHPGLGFIWGIPAYGDICFRGNAKMGPFQRRLTVFLSRHEKGHRLSSSDINYRANIDVPARGRD